MNPVQRFFAWLDPIPPDQRKLAAAFDAETQAAQLRVTVLACVLGGIAYLSFALSDYLLYPYAFWPLLALRVCLTAVFWISAAVGHWWRTPMTVYRSNLGTIVLTAVLVGLMLIANRDPTGPYWVFYFQMIIFIGIFPWPAHWMLVAGLTMIGCYVIMSPWAGALTRPAEWGVYIYYLLADLAAIVVVHKLLARVRWEGFYHLLRARQEKALSEKLVNVVIPIGVALSAEKDFNRLLEMIVREAQSLCNADAGSLYLREQDRLRFVVMRNNSIKMALGGATGQPIPFPPLSLCDPVTHAPNEHNVATYVTHTGTPVNIADAYQVEGFDFSGVKEYDRSTGYRSQSFLTVPLKNDQGYVIGVLQLLNAQDPETGQVISFDEYLQPMVESLAALGAVMLEVYIREQSLRQQIEQLRIEVDEVKRAKQVAEITETDYFQQLQQKAKTIRGSKRG